LRRTFYERIERANFRTAWVDGGPSFIVRKSAAVGGKLSFVSRHRLAEVPEPAVGRSTLAVLSIVTIDPF